MKKFPSKKIELDIEALGGVITLTELTIEYRELCNQDPSYDNTTNGLINAGMTQEQVNKLGENVGKEIMNEVIDLTYPNMREKLQELIESGEYVPPTKTEKEESKKN